MLLYSCLNRIVHQKGEITMSNMKDDVSRIVESIGGAENIQSATHCVTRLRLILKDQSKVNVEALDNIDLVKGNFLAGGPVSDCNRNKCRKSL